ncbi:hypothetical protein LINPERHAP2_LOCUS35995 [Linum perenne]
MREKEREGAAAKEEREERNEFGPNLVFIWLRLGFQNLRNCHRDWAEPVQGL